MRTVSNLLSLDGRVWVYLSSTTLAKLFLKNAEAEGFTFVDGSKPTERDTSDIVALHLDWTINYVGFAGHMAFRNPNSVIGEPLVRVDYGKYLAGRDDFIMQNNPPVKTSPISSHSESTCHQEQIPCIPLKKGLY